MSRNDDWVPPPDKEFEPLSAVEWLRVLRRAVPFAILVFGGLLILLLVRLIEAPIFRMRRPVTPSITKFVCRNSLRVIGMGYIRQGTPMRHAGAMVANHSSWLDIFALNAGQRLYFVSKAEVAKWPGIGWLARATGTVFIRRNRVDAKVQTRIFEDRLLAGHKLMFFPEGTSTDGLQVIPFKTPLFEAFLSPRLRHKLWLQPVSLLYLAPDGKEMSFYGWWGDMDFVPHLISVLAAKRQGSVLVTYHPPVDVDDHPNRKALAMECEMRVRSGSAI